MLNSDLWTDFDLMLAKASILNLYKCAYLSVKRIMTHFQTLRNLSTYISQVDKLLTSECEFLFPVYAALILRWSAIN